MRGFATADPPQSLAAATPVKRCRCQGKRDSGDAGRTRPTGAVKTGMALSICLSAPAAMPSICGKRRWRSLSFLGGTLVAISTVIWRPAKMRWTALVSVMEDAGLDAVPIIAFLSFFVGMVVAFIGATTLAQFGATIFVVELVGFGVLRELGGVLVAIIIAGRTNSAFTAQIGAMKMRQEIDAMQTLGLESHACDRCAARAWP